MRFDEVELETVPLGNEDAGRGGGAGTAPAPEAAPRFRRLMALLTDLSLFAALALALSPLLPQPSSWMTTGALAGFVVVLSYYYYVGTWMLWGKTIGGAIFDVRVVRDTRAGRDLPARRVAALVWGGSVAAAVRNRVRPRRTPLAPLASRPDVGNALHLTGLHEPRATAMLHYGAAGHSERPEP
jgi:hypothetical protein